MALAASPVMSLLRSRNAVETNILVGHIHSNSQPDVVAHHLAQVEHYWMKDRLAAFSGATTRALALSRTVVSCSKVVYSIASSRMVSSPVAPQVDEYMKSICVASETPNDKNMCQKFAAIIRNSMESGLVITQWSKSLPHLCTSFFDGAVTEGARALQEQEQQQEHGRAEQQQEDEEVANQSEAKAEAAEAPEAHAKFTAELDSRIRKDEIEREFASIRAARMNFNDDNDDKDPELGMWNDLDDTDDVTTTLPPALTATLPAAFV